ALHLTAAVTYTVKLSARRCARGILSLENRRVWLSPPEGSPGAPNLARIAIALPNLRNAWSLPQKLDCGQWSGPICRSRRVWSSTKYLQTNSRCAQFEFIFEQP